MKQTKQKLELTSFGCIGKINIGINGIDKKYGVDIQKAIIESVKERTGIEGKIIESKTSGIGETAKANLSVEFPIKTKDKKTEFKIYTGTAKNKGHYELIAQAYVNAFNQYIESINQ